MKSVKEILVAARDKIADEKNWTQGEFARDANGDDVNAVSNKAVCWCAIGSLISVLPEDLSFDSVSLWKLVDSASGGSSYAFNDSHTHAEVLGLFDKLIAAQPA